MADMMKYTGAINILRSDRILPRAWRLEIADMLETISTMEKHREISTLDDSSHVSSHSGDGVLHRSGSRSGDPGAGGGACDPVAAVRDDGHSAGPARADGLIHGALYVYDATTQTFDPAVPSAWQWYAGGSWQTVSKRDVRDPEQYAKSIGPARAIYYVGDQR